MSAPKPLTTEATIPLRPLAVTCGDPAGIGPEISLAAWAQRINASLPPFFIIGDADHFASVAKRLSLHVPIKPIEAASEAIDCFATHLPVLHSALSAPVTLGHPSSDNGRSVIGAIDKAVALTQGGEAAGLITNPIHKASLMNAGFSFPGHTEYLGHLTSSPRAVMMLAIEGLRVVPVTVHLPLKDVATALSQEAIVETGLITAKALSQDFGISNPHLAVAGLNPHAGEEGKLGTEEGTIITPAINALKKAGLNVSGPHAADSLMAADMRATYDAALCMYHDQALIPLKTLDFHGGVNITLGLPLVRTSPDHGTAFDLAGKGSARPDSLMAAIKQASLMSQNRMVP